MKKRYIILLALIGIFCFQFFLVERTEYVAGEIRYYTFSEKYLDTEINVASSSAFENDIYNLQRITNNIASDFDKTENIREDLIRVYENLNSNSATLEFYMESIDKLNEYDKEIQIISDDLRLQKNYLKELSDYITENENQTQSKYYYISDIQEHLSHVFGLDTTLNNFSHFTSNLTSVVETTVEKTRQEQIRRQREERLIQEQRLRNQIALEKKSSNQSSNFFNGDYSTSFQNSSNNSRATSSIKFYTNTDGNRVQSPTHYSSQPSGATALCNDGTYSFSQNRRGTCSGHGGVRKWL